MGGSGYILRNATPYDIFYGALKNNPSCNNHSFREKLKSWSDSYPMEDDSTDIPNEDVPVENNFSEPEFAMDDYSTPAFEPDFVVDDCPTSAFEIDNCSTPEFEIDNHLELGNKITEIEENVKHLKLEKIEEKAENNDHLKNSTSLDGDSNNKIATPNPSDNTVSDHFSYNLVKSKLFSRYRYGKFISSDAYRNVFYSTKRPSLSLWSDFLASLVSDNCLCEIKSQGKTQYKFNINKDNGSNYIDHSFLITLIENASRTSNTLTAMVLKRKIRYNKRPSTSEWTAYLEDAVSDNDIRLETVNGKTFFFMIFY